MNNKLEITKTEKKIITILSKAAYTIKELSIILDCKETTIRDHLCNLREKGLIFDMLVLNDNPRKVYFSKELTT